MTTKKVPALTLIVVGLVGMVAGVLATSMTIGQVSNSGETGTYHNNTGAFTVTDTGLAVVANSATSNSSTAFTITSSNSILMNTLAAGDWMDIVTFHMASPASGTHIATLAFRNGTGPQGSSLATVTSGTWTTTASSSGTVTFYVDLGVQSITAPVTAYVNIT